MGDLESCWEEIDKMLVIQFGEIKASFKGSHIVFEHRYKGNFLYSKLKGYVSRPALSFGMEKGPRHSDLLRKIVVVFKRHRTSCHVHVLLP